MSRPKKKTSQKWCKTREKKRIWDLILICGFGDLAFIPIEPIVTHNHEKSFWCWKKARGDFYERLNGHSDNYTLYDLSFLLVINVSANRLCIIQMIMFLHIMSVNCINCLLWWRWCLCGGLAGLWSYYCPTGESSQYHPIYTQNISPRLSIIYHLISLYYPTMHTTK